jgi:3-mercaptopyruvate sulfurtransferase SseA
MSQKSRKNNSMGSAPLLIAGAGLALLLFGAFLLLRPRPQTIAVTKTPEPQHSVEETFPEISRASLADSKAALDSGKAVFVDVRDASAYAEAHIPGALSIPLAELETRLNELDPNQWIITYCT